MNRDNIVKRFDDKWAEDFIEKEKNDLFNREHICPVLRMLILRCFLCELMYDVDLSDAKKILLDDIIYVNQNIIRIMKQSWKSIFPEYFESISADDSEKCMSEEIQDWEFNEYDIRPYYSKLLKILNESDIPEGIMRDRMIENTEYGLYIGCLMNLEVSKFENLKPNENEKAKLNQIRDKFKFGMDVRFKKLKEMM